MTDLETTARTRIALVDPLVGQTIRVCGWVRTLQRPVFAIIDGSTLQNLQLVVDRNH